MIRPRALLVGLGALVLLGALAALSLANIMAPAPRGTQTPPTEFSAARAFAHDQRVAARTHVAGSPANDEVRDYLVSTLRGLGLTTEVQDAVGASPDGDGDGGSVSMARVRNVVAALPGTASTGRVFLVAHYDSVQNGPGGSDDGAGVSAILETARAMTAGPRPGNDIIFVLTDAEEACLCGAEAFAGQHRLAAGGGVVLNLEARGSGGPVIMFETSTGNARLVDVFAAHAPHPVGTSFAVEVYRILPNDTDFTRFLQRGGFTGLNSAFIDGSAAYHTPQDTPSMMDQASLQQHGANALALARAFGAADLATLSQPGAFDATYFPVPGLLVRYPGWLVWPLAALAVFAVAALAWALRGRGELTLPRTAAAFGLTLVPLLLAPVAAQLLWLGLVALRPGYAEMIDPWRPGWFRVAVLGLVGLVLFGWYALSRRRIGPAALAVGALAWLAGLGVGLAAMTPGGSYLAALPALAGAGAGLIGLAVRPAWGRLAAQVAGAAVAVLILAPTVVLFFPALGLATGGAAAFFAVLLGLALLPVLEWIFPAADAQRERARRWWAAAPAVVSAGLALVGVIAGLAGDRFDAARPAPSQLMYALDADSGQALWVSAEAAPSGWTDGYVGGCARLTDCNATADISERFPTLGGLRATGPAQAATLPAPELRVVADTTSGGVRRLIVTLRPQRSVRLVFLGVQAGPRVVSATVAGRPVPVGSGPFRVLFHAPPPEGVTFQLVLAGSGPVTFRIMDGSDGLAELPGFVPRPPEVGVAGTHTSDLVLVSRTYQI
ncbi:MAG: M28 family peptidase [Micromonosporaceae bacterium]